ncbi:MAG: hypothetical protein JWP13_716 [Candidatus Saccharibacteria bacterium]|nr:hypothetical protein [Candidatus Saccharibacteria bacterium]
MGSTNCSALMSKQEEAYNQEIKQERRSLDSSLSIQLGLSISSDIVAGFNKTAAAILNKYAAAAKTSNCTFPVKQPPVLPLTYQP